MNSYNFDIETARANIDRKRYKEDWSGINNDFRAVCSRLIRCGQISALDSIYIPIKDKVLS